MKARHVKKDPREPLEVQLQEYAISLWRLCGRDDCRAWHPANEGARSPRTGAALLRQGMWTGMADVVVFFAGGRFACMEIKTRKGRLTTEQRDFRDWCEKYSVPYAVCRSSDEIAAKYREWNVLRAGVQIGAIARPDLKIVQQAAE